MSKVDRQKFFDLTRAIPLGGTAELLQQLKAGFPAGDTIQRMNQTMFLMGLRVGMAVGVKDVAVARLAMAWMDGDRDKAVDPAISLQTTQTLDDHAEEILGLFGRV